MESAYKKIFLFLSISFILIFIFITLVSAQSTCDEQSVFKINKNYIREYLYEAHSNPYLVIPSAKEVLYPYNLKDKFDSASELERYIVTKTNLDIGGPSNLVSCALYHNGYPLAIHAGVLDDVRADKIELKLAAAHYYNVMNLLRNSQAATLENLAAINTYFGKKDLFSDGERALVINDKNPFKNYLEKTKTRVSADPPQLTRDATIKTTKDILRTIAPLEAEMKFLEPYTFPTFPGSEQDPTIGFKPIELFEEGILHINRDVNTEFKRYKARCEFYNAIVFRHSPAAMVAADDWTKLSDEELYKIGTLNKFPEDFNYFDGTFESYVKYTSSCLMFEKSVMNAKERRKNLDQVIKGVIWINAPWILGSKFEMYRKDPHFSFGDDLPNPAGIDFSLVSAGVDAQFEKNREVLFNHFNDLQEAIVLFNNPDAKASDIKSKLDEVLSHTLPYLKVEEEVGSNSRDASEKAILTNYLQLSDETLNYKKNLKNTEYEGWEGPVSAFSMVGLLVVAGAAGGPLSTITGYMRAATSGAVFETGASTTSAIIGLAMVGGDIVFISESWEEQSAVCNKLVLSSKVGDTSKVGDKPKTPLVGPTEMSVYQACVTARLLAGLQIGAAVVVPEIVHRLTTTQDAAYVNVGKTVKEYIETGNMVLEDSSQATLSEAYRSVDNVFNFKFNDLDATHYNSYMNELGMEYGNIYSALHDSSLSPSLRDALIDYIRTSEVRHARLIDESLKPVLPSSSLLKTEPLEAVKPRAFVDRTLKDAKPAMDFVDELYTKFLANNPERKIVFMPRDANVFQVGLKTKYDINGYNYILSGQTVYRTTYGKVSQFLGEGLVDITLESRSFESMVSYIEKRLNGYIIANGGGEVAQKMKLDIKNNLDELIDSGINQGFLKEVPNGDGTYRFEGELVFVDTGLMGTYHIFTEYMMRSNPEFIFNGKTYKNSFDGVKREYYLFDSEVMPDIGYKRAGDFVSTFDSRTGEVSANRYVTDVLESFYGGYLEYSPTQSMYHRRLSTSFKTPVDIEYTSGRVSYDGLSGQYSHSLLEWMVKDAQTVRR